MNVLTGGPCAGKTTIIRVLQGRGFTVVPEAARAVIEEVESGRRERMGFQQFQIAILEHQLAAEGGVRGVRDQKVFLDRGTLDNIAYCHTRRKRVPQDLITHGWAHAEVRPYARVFLLDLLPYQRDGVRFEDDEFAARVHDNILRTYETHGYEVVRVPVMPVEERADFIVERARLAR